jgi:outer membrane biosynthesis protein TonB
MNRYLYRFRARLGVAALLCGSVYALSHAIPILAQDSAQSGAAPVQDSKAGAITEDELKQMLAGKTFYLRGGYLDNTLSFDEHGNLIGHSPQGSFTLCLIQIDKVHLSKHKMELEGIRYGLHFLGELPNEDPTKAVDRVRITPKKKLVRITIDRELVVSPKKKKDKKADKAVTAKQSSAEPIEESAASVNAKAETAAAPESEHPADGKGVTTTTSPAHAKRVLQAALDAIFAPSLDERMIATLPDFWKLYYLAAAAHADYSPADSGILRQNQVDQKAKLLSPVEPPSNEYAQAGGVAGMALYHAIIGPDGKPQEVVVGRPIGFGLDENAADSIRKASFQPAIKDGKPVAVLLDLVVQFRIYSKRTGQPARPESSPASTTTILPGPYSVNQP